MKKLLTGLLVLFISAYVSFSYGIFDSLYRYTVFLNNIKTVTKNFSDKKCKADLKKQYVFSLYQRSFKLSPTQTFNLTNYNISDNENGIQIFTGEGYWEGTEFKTTKQFKSDVIIKGTKSKKVITGIFSNKYCKGEFVAKLN